MFEGPVGEVQVVKDKVAQCFKGAGRVEFKDEESFPKAFGQIEQNLHGTTIIAQLTEAEKKRQARTTEGPATVHAIQGNTVASSLSQEQTFLDT